jgi:DNA-binding response OmpR family regulator
VLKVLLVEDDDRVSLALTDVLGRHGIAVCRVRTAAQAVIRMGADIDVVILDLGLPDHDGMGVLTRLRRECDVPIVISTARGDLGERLHGLDLGADDYLVKPYESLELLARIHAVLRRTGRTVPLIAPGTVGVAAVCSSSGGRVRVDVARHTVHVEGRLVSLSRKEFDVLALLCTSPGVVFRRGQLLSKVWTSRWKGDEHTLEVHVASLRAKLGVPDVIETVRGVGYRLHP